MKKSQKPIYLPALDGLRGIAILLVLLAHGSPTPEIPLLAPFWHMVQTLRTGYVGVDLFFALSGFLITRLLLAERAGTGRIDLRAFYVRRAIRIFPIYYLAVAVAVLAWPTSPGAAASLLLYVYNYYLPLQSTPYPLEQVWSLAVEEQFYLVWPFVVSALPLPVLRTTTGVVMPLVAIGIALLLAAALPPALAGEFIYTSLPTRLFSLMLGASLAVRAFEGRPIGSRPAMAIAAGGGTVLLATVAARAVHVLPAGGWYWCCALPGYGLIAAGTVAASAAPDALRPLRHVLSLPPLRFVGRIGYGLYLYHLPIFYALHINQARVGDHGVPVRHLAGAYALSFCAASVSFYALERPLLRMRAAVA